MVKSGMAEKRILVTGSRELTDEQLVCRALYDHGIGRFTIVVGDCPTGADLFARNYSSIYGLPIEVFQADWDAFGKAAGPKRNQAMVDSGANMCLAFIKVGAGNRGTLNCAGQARAAGVQVITYTEGPR